MQFTDYKERIVQWKWLEGCNICHFDWSPLSNSFCSPCFFGLNF